MQLEEGYQFKGQLSWGRDFQSGLINTGAKVFSATREVGFLFSVRILSPLRKSIFHGLIMERRVYAKS